MGLDQNKAGAHVVFLPEHTDGRNSADALTVVCGNITTADFKYSSTTKANTLEQDLIHGFRQARSIVLKLENIDSGNFSDAVEYMLRNEKRLEFRIGNIRILNKYGKYRDITRADMRRNTYAKKIKGFL